VALVTPKLEFAPASLATASPTWVDVTADLIDAEWWNGKANDLDEPQAGGATFRLANVLRKWEPEYRGILANQVTNPSFESPQDLTGWTSAGGTNSVSANNPTHGEQALHVVSVASGQGMDYRQLAVVSGQRYAVSVDVHLAGGSGSASLRVSDGAGTQKAIATTATDTRLYLEFVADATASNWRVRLLTSTPGASWDLYFDSVMVTELPAPTGLASDIYIDGTTGGGHWIGTAHASASYYGGVFYPNIDTERRFRLTMTDATGAVQQGVFYAESWNVEYPAGTRYSEVIVSCVDGFGLLTADALPTLDPPDATSYPDVVTFDQPPFYYRQGETEGTKVVHHVRKIRRRGYVAHGTQPAILTSKKRWKTLAIRTEVEGVSGPSGTYKNRPLLGEDGAIVGDPDGSVRYTRANNEYARIGPLDQSDLIDRNVVSVEALVKAASLSTLTNGVVCGPFNASYSEPVFQLTVSGSPSTAHFTVKSSGGGFSQADQLLTTITAGLWYHLVGTWNGSRIRLYINGILEDDHNDPRTMGAGVVGEYIRIGAWYDDTLTWDGWIDEVAIYERELSPARVQAHYLAAFARGYPQQLTGARIAAAATSPLWSTAGVEAGAFEVLPIMHFGQAKLDPIIDAVQVERPKALFFFDGSGNPIFRDFDSLDGAALADTFGDAPGETTYTDVDLVYDNEVFNQVTGSRDGGEAIVLTDATSIAARKTRARDDESGMPLASDDDVRTVLTAIVSEWANPTLRPNTVSVIGADAVRVSDLLRRTIGQTVRVKRRGEGGIPIDRQAVILGYRKSLSRDRVLTGTFNLSRGFNAGVSSWRLGTTGFDELGTATVLG
jgi:hypothetical protein